MQGRHAGLIFVLFAVTLAAAPICDYEFQCVSPGAANNALCAQVAPFIDAQYTSATNTLRVTLSSYNGILLTQVQAIGDFGIQVFGASIHSNSGWQEFVLAGLPTQIQVVSLGIAGPTETDTFVGAPGADCCNPVPEPGTGMLFAGAAALLLVLALRKGVV